MAHVALSQDQVRVPLVVDLDGTLIKTDLLIESLLSLLSHRPLHAVAAIGALRFGKAAMKARIAALIDLPVAVLPMNEDVLALVRAEKAAGRRVYLASASNHKYVEAVATHLGLFDGVFASDGNTNMGGAVKAAALCEAFGEGAFDYAGDAEVDMEVWAKARGGVVVDGSPSLLRKVRARFPHLTEISSPKRGLGTYARALRPHQWLKNLLIFIPALAAHAFGAALGNGLVAFASFSLCASSVYLLNDLVDLNNDREHPTKSRRPFACGALPLTYGLVLFPILLLAAVSLALLLPQRFLIVLSGYYALTVAYSFRLKKKMAIDVVTLAGLYGVRLVAGAAAAAVPLSSWLSAFAIFLFFSLALVKRCTELIGRIEAGKGDPSGRGYRLGDVPVLLAMASAAGYVSVLVMALYIDSPAVSALYRSPERLWAVCIVLVYWISRVLLLTQRGEMHDDPVVFAATDRVSIISVGLIGAAVVGSI